jgi:hypothetical protein
MNTDRTKAMTTATQMELFVKNLKEPTIALPIPKIVEITFMSRETHKLRPNLSHLSRSMTTASITLINNVLIMRPTPTVTSAAPTLYIFHRFIIAKQILTLVVSFPIARFFAA